jgi:hypothetical protein
MEPPLRIPRRYEGGLARIRSLSDESVQELLSALQEVPLTFNEDSLTSKLASRVSAIPPSDLYEIVSALLSLYSLRDAQDLAISEVAEGNACCWI